MSNLCYNGQVLAVNVDVRVQVCLLPARNGVACSDREARWAAMDVARNLNKSTPRLNFQNNAFDKEVNVWTSAWPGGASDKCLDQKSKKS